MYNLDSDVDVSSSKKRSKIDTSKYRCPNVIDLRDFCLPTNNQGNTPHCVGYTVAGFLEVHNWMNTHIPVQFNAEKLYEYGRKYKTDSMSGTRLEYVLEQLKTENIISGSYIRVDPLNIKYFIHQYGVLMGAFYVTDEWYTLSKKHIIKEKKSPKKLGGHCVLCCGYCMDGSYIQNSWGYEKWGNYGFAIVPWNLVGKQLSYAIGINNLKMLNITELFYEEQRGS